ncbi:MAG: 2Fe-2S iron-sulfur cluster binding domain-containing protein [Planctomycetes bacterium]|nr:2Fe-2S iron-sulfur cluster binding domain-containing protein [Planctomycetota bacterium]
MAKVTFKPSGKVIDIPKGENLLTVVRREKLNVNSKCGGAPTCALCRIVIESGDENLSQVARKESDLIGTSYYITKKRLACQTLIVGEGDITIDLSEHSEEDKVEKNFKSPFRTRMPSPEDIAKKEEAMKSRKNKDGSKSGRFPQSKSGRYPQSKSSGSFSKHKSGEGQQTDDQERPKKKSRPRRRPQNKKNNTSESRPDHSKASSSESKPDHKKTNSSESRPDPKKSSASDMRPQDKKAPSASSEINKSAAPKPNQADENS